MILRVQEDACIWHVARTRAVQVNNAWAGLSPLHIFFNTDNIGFLLENMTY